MQQRWKAIWVEAGQRREFIFESINSYTIARIDFKLKYTHVYRGKAAPAHFDLQEVEDGGDQGTALASAPRRLR